MPISAKRKLVAGATGLAVLAGTGGAYAATQSSTPSPTRRSRRERRQAAEQKAFLDDVAKRLNVTRDQLDTAIKGAAEARIDAAVAAGKLTQGAGRGGQAAAGRGRAAARAGPAPGGGPHPGQARIAAGSGSGSTRPLTTSG